MILLLMDKAKADALAATDFGPWVRLAPVRVEAGPYAGKYVLGPTCRDDPDFAGADWSGVNEVNLDTTEAWPGGDL